MTKKKQSNKESVTGIIDTKYIIQEKIRKIDEMISEINGHRMTMALQQQLSNLKNTKITLQNLLLRKNGL